MWQEGSVHPTHDMAKEISHVAEANDGNTLYAEEMDIELGGSNARHGAAMGYAVNEDYQGGLAAERASVAVRSGNQDPEQIGYANSLAWSGFGDEQPVDETTTESQAPAAVKAEMNKFVLWGSVGLAAWWLWARR